MLKQLVRNKIKPIDVSPGDTVILHHVKTTAGGQVVSTVEAARHEVTKNMRGLDTAVIFEVQDELGLKIGIGGMFGRE